jgi:hypothetical protein
MNMETQVKNYCTHCGKKLNALDNFCGFCGKKINSFDLDIDNPPKINTPKETKDFYPVYPYPVWPYYPYYDVIYTASGTGTPPPSTPPSTCS